MVISLNKNNVQAIVQTNDSRYYFDIIVDHSISIQNQITDNYIENNSAIQDHIAHTPITVTVRGLIGEVVFTPPTRALSHIGDMLYNKLGYNAYNILTDKLTVIPALLPPVDNITQAAKNAIQYVEASIDRYTQIFKRLTSKEQRKPRLKLIYNKLKDFRDDDSLMTVYTPFTTFDNMAIQSISLTQGNVNHVGDIEITFKQVNWANTKTTEPDKNVMAKYNEYAKSQETNNGKADGKSVSLSRQILNKINPNLKGKGNFYNPNSSK